MEKSDLFQDLPSALEAEAVQVLAQGGTTRIERVVSHGQASPEGFWYDQEEAEWVALLKGGAALSFPDAPDLVLKPGECCLLPPHRRHRVAWTAPDQDTVWLCVFFKA